MRQRAFMSVLNVAHVHPGLAIALLMHVTASEDVEAVLSGERVLALVVAYDVLSWPEHDTSWPGCRLLLMILEHDFQIDRVRSCVT